MKWSEKTTEDAIENYVVALVKQLRGLTVKIRFMRGWPDRLVLLPGGIVLFIELKRPKGGAFEPLQLRIHDKLRVLGLRVHVAHTKALVDDIFKEFV